jgi:hypothetical protein
VLDAFSGMPMALRVFSFEMVRGVLRAVLWHKISAPGGGAGIFRVVEFHLQGIEAGVTSSSLQPLASFFARLSESSGMNPRRNSRRDSILGSEGNRIAG